MEVACWRGISSEPMSFSKIFCERLAISETTISSTEAFPAISNSLDKLKVQMLDTNSAIIRALFAEGRNNSISRKTKAKKN
jgi:hypothetical protein